MTKEEFKKLAEEHLFILEGYSLDKNGNKEMQIYGFDELYEQLLLHDVSNRRELLIAYEVKKHPFLADKYKLEYATKLVDRYLKSN